MRFSFSSQSCISVLNLSEYKYSLIDKIDTSRHNVSAPLSFLEDYYSCHSTSHLLSKKFKVYRRNAYCSLAGDQVIA